MFRTIITVTALGLAVCACNSQGGVTDPKVNRGIVDPSLDSGVTSNNGGGQRATGAAPNIPLGTSSPSGLQHAPNSRGAAY